MKIRVSKTVFREFTVTVRFVSILKSCEISRAMMKMESFNVTVTIKRVGLFHLSKWCVKRQTKIIIRRVRRSQIVDQIF